MFSQTSEYALRAAVFLAQNSREAFTTQQISEATKVPAPYLSKVLKSLVSADIVISQRGIGGGFVLSRKASEISVLDVINAVDPLQRIKTCPLGIEDHKVKLCALHKKLDDAFSYLESTFAETSLRDLTKTSRLCEEPITRDVFKHHKAR